MADYEGVEKLVFSMKEPTSWASRSRPIRVTIGPKSHTRHWDFEIKGSFVERSCSINDHGGNFVAQVRRYFKISFGLSCLSKDLAASMIMYYNGSEHSPLA